MVTVRSLKKLCLKGLISIETYARIRKSLRRPRKIFKAKRFQLEKYKDDVESLGFFRFTSFEIKRLIVALKIPAIRLTNRTTCSAEEGLCILLRRLSYPNRLRDLVKMFYRSKSTISEIFNWVLKHLYVKTVHLISRLRQPWMLPEIFKRFANICKEAGSYYDTIVGFVDGTARGICRPKYRQRFQYSGYKKTHVLKYQSVVYPNGLIGRLDGPFNGHRHDAAILNLSQMKLDMKQEFDCGNNRNFAVYGDPGYSNQKYIKVGFKNYRQLSSAQKLFNREMSALRVSVEYGFGKIIQQFAFLDYKKNQKLYLQFLKEQYYVAAILVNCQTCLRGNQISKYFDLNPSTLEEYLAIQ